MLTSLCLHPDFSVSNGFFLGATCLNSIKAFSGSYPVSLEWILRVFAKCVHGPSLLCTIQCALVVHLVRYVLPDAALSVGLQ